MFNNTYASSGSEIVAFALTGLIYKKFGTRTTMCMGWIIALIGGLLILILSSQYEAWMPIFVMFAKFGVSVSFALVYIVTVTIFPTLFCGTAFGVCNLFARGFSVLAPQVAELSDPIPMTIFSILAAIAAIIAPFLILEKEKK